MLPRTSQNPSLVMWQFTIHKLKTHVSISYHVSHVKLTCVRTLVYMGGILIFWEWKQLRCFTLWIGEWGIDLSTGERTNLIILKTPSYRVLVGITKVTHMLLYYGVTLKSLNLFNMTLTLCTRVLGCLPSPNVVISTEIAQCWPS